MNNFEGLLKTRLQQQLGEHADAVGRRRRWADNKHSIGPFDSFVWRWGQHNADS
jgi:hypothetical protein